MYHKKSLQKNKFVIYVALFVMLFGLIANSLSIIVYAQESDEIQTNEGGTNEFVTTNVKTNSTGTEVKVEQDSNLSKTDDVKLDEYGEVKVDSKSSNSKSDKSVSYKDSNEKSNINENKSDSSDKNLSETNLETKKHDSNQWKNGEIDVDIWADLNGNGIEDDEDKDGIEEDEIDDVTIEVKLYKEDGDKLVDSGSTSDGEYEFKNLQEGVYYVKVFVPKSNKYLGITKYIESKSGEYDEINGYREDGSTNSTIIGKSESVTISKSYNEKNVDCGIKVSEEVANGKAILGDFVWNDTNGNGIQDEGEKGIPGVKVELLLGESNASAKYTVVAETKTDKDGKYIFTNVSVPNKHKQKYKVRVYLPDGYTDVSPHLKGSDKEKDSDFKKVNKKVYFEADIEQVAPNMVDYSIDCGFICENVKPVEEKGSITVTVWDDENQNGWKDDNEEVIKGAYVTVYDKDHNIVGESPTDENGQYKVEKLKEGTYYVHVKKPDGTNYEPTVEPATNPDQKIKSEINKNGFTSTFAVDGGDVAKYAGMYSKKDTSPVEEKGSITVTVWDDENQNGWKDDNEKVIKGAYVTVYDKDHNIVGESPTDENGQYKVEKLKEGTYYVHVKKPDGTNYEPTVEPATNPDQKIKSEIDKDGFTSTFAVYDGDVAKYAGMYSKKQTPVDPTPTPDPTPTDPTNATIGDFVWNDTNKNGIQDAGEEGVDSITVILYDANKNKVAETKTVNGAYSFTNLTVGTYYVGVVIPSDLMPTTALLGTSSSLDSNGYELDATGTIILSNSISLAMSENNNTVDFGFIAGENQNPGGGDVAGDTTTNPSKPEGTGTDSEQGQTSDANDEQVLGTTTSNTASINNPIYTATYSNALPQTGDNGVGSWIALATLAALTIVGVVVIGKRGRKN